MLEFICSASGSNTTDEIYKRIEADHKNGRSVYILVPEQYSMYAESELLSRLGTCAQNNVQVLTFSRLSNLVFSKLGPLRNQYIDKAGKYLMACRALQLCSKKLKVFTKGSSQFGLASILVSAISEFKRYGITPADLESAANSTDDKVLGFKLFDLALIYEEFDHLVETEYSNTEDSLALSTPRICECDFLSGIVYTDFFRSFTPTEYSALGELMKKCDLCVGLCTDTLSESSLLFSSQVSTIKKLSVLADSLGVEKKPPVFLKSNENDLASTDIKYLRDNYFSYGAPRFDGKVESIHIYRPSSFYAEVQKCAQTICRLCRTKGYSFNDFLILTGDIKNYELILPSVFEEYDIKYFIDTRYKISESPLMKMIMACLEILAYGFSYDRVMVILRSGFWDISRDEADIFENYLLAANLSHKAWNSTEAWEYNPAPHCFDMTLINEIKGKTIDKIISLLKRFKGRKTVKEICENLCIWLNSLDLHLLVSTKIEKFNISSHLQYGQQLYGIWNSFVSVINQISDCMSNTYVTFTEFYEIFCSACGELSVGVIPPTRDNVLISEINHFRSTGKKVVIVLGVIDKIFPGGTQSEGLISDAERIKLKDAGLILAPDAYSRQKENLFLIYSIFDTAQDELYIFSPISDRDGKSLGSSEIVNKIKNELFLDININTDFSEFEEIEGSEHTFAMLAAKLFETNWDITSLTPMWRTVYKCFEDRPEYQERLNKLSAANERRSIPSEISKETAARLYGLPLVLSVSKLERYNSCAFSFFMQYGLYAKERLLGGLKATDTGSMLHSALCEYFESNKDADFSKIKKDDCFDAVARIVDKISSNSSESALASSNFYNYIMLRIKNIASSTAWKLVKFYENSEFRPAGFEVSFGKRGSLPPYKIETPSGEVFLEGFIDKVDSAILDGQEYILVTDYKSSEKGFDPRLVDAGITIQPLIYANAVTENRSNAKTAAVMYIQMNDPILSFDFEPDDKQWEAGMSGEIKCRGMFLDSPAVINGLDKNAEIKDAVHYAGCDVKSRYVEDIFKEKFKNAKECAAKTADKILDGCISAESPSISGFDPCRYCPFGNVCRKE